MIITVLVETPDGTIHYIHSSQVPRVGDLVSVFDNDGDDEIGTFVVSRINWLFSPTEEDAAEEVMLCLDEIPDATKKAMRERIERFNSR